MFKIELTTLWRRKYSWCWRGHWCNTSSVNQRIRHANETAEIHCADIVLVIWISNYRPHYRLVHLQQKCQYIEVYFTTELVAKQ